MAAAGVIAGRERYSVECADNLDWLRGLPDGCCSLCITSPPYEDARTYGVGFRLAGEAWVEWMVPRVVECCRVVKGLVCVNMAGKVRDHSYSPVVEWLVADLTRHHGLVCGPAPYCFFRFGIPGSGSKHYHRRDHEPVYCFARPESLPLKWSDNTAMGHPPKWAPGGEMSHRLTNGQRVSQWGKNGGPRGMGNKDVNGEKESGVRPSHSSTTKEEAAGEPLLFEGAEPIEPPPSLHPLLQGGGNAGKGRDPDGSKVTRRSKAVKRGATRGYKDGDTLNEGEYVPPVLANPGSVVRELYDAEKVRQLLDESRDWQPGDVLRCLVGGGLMGDDLAHENEAPFPERLAEFFVRSYAPPDSLVLDPFCGSGTTLKVALAWGRRALGCDVRESQCELTRRRLSGLGTLFDSLDAPAAGQE